MKSPVLVIAFDVITEVYDRGPEELKLGLRVLSLWAIKVLVVKRKEHRTINLFLKHIGFRFLTVKAFPNSFCYSDSHTCLSYKITIALVQMNG